MIKVDLIVLCVLILMALANAANSKIPSADDIEDYNDPILREVFASSKNTQPADGGVEQLPQLNRNSGTTQSVRPEFKQPSAPIQQPVYTNYQQPPSISQNYNAQPADLGSLAAQGAQSFVQGAQEVGRVLGIDSSSYNHGGSAYEFPLGGGFFGR